MTSGWKKDRLAALIMTLVGLTIWMVSWARFGLDPASALADIGTALVVAGIVYFLSTLTSKFFLDRHALPDVWETLKSDLRMMGINLHDLHKNRDRVMSRVRKLSQDKAHSQPVTLRFLMLDPDLPFLSQREIEENRNCGGRLAKQAKDSLRTLEDLRNFIQENNVLNVKGACRVYTAMPKHALILKDGKVFLGPYLYRKQGVDSPWIEVTEENARRHYESEFEELWHDAKEIWHV